MRDSFDKFQPADRGRFGDNEADSREVKKLSRSASLNDITVTVTRKTERAALVRDIATGREFWLPLSQIELSPLAGGKSYNCAIPHWLCKENGIL